MVKTSICYRAWFRITCKLVMSSERPCHKRIRNLLSYCIKDKKAKTTGLWSAPSSISYIHVVEIKIVLYSKMDKNTVENQSLNYDIRGSRILSGVRVQQRILKFAGGGGDWGWEGSKAYLWLSYNVNLRNLIF